MDVVIMNEVVWDIETDNLLDSLTKLHVFSFKWNDDHIKSTADPEVIREVMTQEDTLYIGHHTIGFDCPALKKLGIAEVSWQSCADTLGLSWTLFPDRQRHGLEFWGTDLGVEKPQIESWTDLTYEQYRFRCESDVEINYRLWLRIKEKLNELYS